MTTAKVEIVVEARTTAAKAGFDNLQKSADGAKTSTAALNREMAQYDKVAGKVSQRNVEQRKALGDTVKGFDQYDKAAGRAAKGTENLGKSFAGTARSVYASKDGFLPAMTQSKSALGQLGGVVDAQITKLGPMGLAGAAIGVAAAIERASARSLQLRDVQGALKISIDAARDSTGGLVDDFTLQTQAVTAVRFGIVKTDADFAKLARTAALLARTTGQDTTTAVSDLTTALARQSPMILDNLGLQVNVERANKTYAASIGKTASQLTDAEKKQAFFNAAMADAEKKTKDISVATEGWAVKVQQAKVSASNLLDDLVQLPEHAGELWKELKTSIPILEEYGDAVALAARIGIGALTLGLSEAIPWVIRLRKELDALPKDANKVRGAPKTFGEISAIAGNVVGDAWTAHLKQVGDGLNVQMALLDSVAVGNRKLDEEVEKLRGNHKKIKEIDPSFFGNDALRRDELSRLQRSRDAVTGQTEEAFDAMGGQFEDARNAFEEKRAKAEADRLKRMEEAKDAAAEASKKRHEEELARQNELIARQEMAAKVAGDTVGGLAQAWLQAGDLSAKGFRKALAEWGKAESIRLAGVAISEGVQALVSLAFFNYPQAALHGAAAAAAGAGAAAIAGLTGAVGGFGSLNKTPSTKGGFGSDMFGGPGVSSTGNGPTPVSNSQSDQLPTAGGFQHAQASGSSSGSSQTVNYNFHPGSIQTLGAIDEKSAEKIEQGLQKARKKSGDLRK